MNRCPTKHIERQAPAYRYVARKPCGCYVASCVANDDAFTAALINGWKEEGYKVECLGSRTERYLNIIDNLGCIHREEA